MYLGVYRYAVMAVFSAIPLLTATGQENDETPYLFDTGKGETRARTEGNSLIINYSVPQINVKGISDQNGQFYRIHIPGHISTADPGKPELPVLSRMIVIPEGSSWKIRITNVKSSPVKPQGKGIPGKLFPAQESEIKSQQQAPRKFAFDKDIYSSRSYLKTDTVRIDPVGTIRQNKLANLIISPVVYNPGKNTFSVIYSMDIEIEFDKGAQVGSSETVDFSDLLSKGTLNYTPEDLITGYSEKPVRMIVLTDTAFKKQIAPYVLWKTQKGFRMEVLYKGATQAGDNYTALKTTIQNIYNASTTDNPAPQYLLIIGDVNRIPYYGTGQVTDMYYGEFTGNGDYMPEMFVGRIPASDTGQVRSTLAKIIQYEKFAFADTTRFYKKAMVTTGYDATYASYLNGQIKYSVSNYLTTANNIQEYHFYYPQASTAAHRDSILELINKGLSFINYTGHGTTTSWMHIPIATSDTSKIKNKSMYPFIISNACQTARYSTSSLGNALVLAKNKGAIGYIGCSNDSYWDEDYYWYLGLGIPSSDPKYETTGLGAIDRLFHTHSEKANQWYTTMGQVVYAGNLAVSASTSTRKKYYWETYNLVGDPSVIPIIGTPSKFTVSIPDTLPNNIKTLNISADPFAYAAVSRNGVLWDASHLSPSGAATLDLPGISNDACTLVLTGQNKIPFIKTIKFANVKSEFINITKSAINDQAGNSNGRADFGESLALDLTISNLGQTSATNLSATITSSSPWITITNGSYIIGNLAGGAETVLTGNLTFALSKNIPDKGIVTIEVVLKDDKTEKRFLYDFTVHAPSLSIINCLMKDTSTGNGNYIADKGETLQMVFQVQNIGSSNTSGQLLISSLQPDITILDAVINTGTLTAGSTNELTVRIRIPDNAATGSSFSVTGNLICDPMSISKTFNFRIGKIRESFESISFRVFPWINISPIPWKITQINQYDGTYSARSGEISHNSSTTLAIRTHYYNADSIRFYYKVSSEPNYDFLIVKVNGTEAFRKSGETTWLRKAIAVPAGYNKIEWIYKKDQSVSGGTDCALIDLIDFSSASIVDYIAKDLVTARITSPVQKDDLGREIVTVKVLNAGPDTLKGFSLAYVVNKNSPVIEKFPDKVIPFGDTVTVSFASKANLSRYGIYNLNIYGTGNSDDYVHNDTLAIKVENTHIDEPLLVFPNPFANDLNIAINTDNPGIVRIRLTDLSGRTIVDEKHYVEWGDNLISIKCGKLASAMYYLKIDAPGIISKTIPLIKSAR